VRKQLSSWYQILYIITQSETKYLTNIDKKFKILAGESQFNIKQKNQEPFIGTA